MSAVGIAAAAVLFMAGTADPPPTTTAPPLASLEGTTNAPAPPTTQAQAQTITGSLPAAPGWLASRNGPLSARFGAGAAWIDGRFVLWGGAPSDDGYTAEGAVFTPGRLGGPWIPTSPAPMLSQGWPPVVAATADSVFIFAEASARYLPESDTWDALDTDDTAAAGVYPLAATWTGQEVILIGYEIHPPRFADNLVAVAFTGDGSCCRALPAPPIDLSHGRAFWTGSEVLLFGGLVDVNGEPIGDATHPSLAAYDPATDLWEIRATPDISGVASLAAAWTGAELIVVDGASSAAAWHPDRGWRALPDVPLEVQNCYPQMAGVADGRAFAWYCGDAALFDPVADRWVRMWTPPWESLSPGGSCALASTVDADIEVVMWCTPTTGDQPLLWQIDLDKVESIAVSPPATDSPWELVPHPQWSDRTGASLAWVGSEFIVWGGFDGITEVYDGWAYAPDTGVMHRIPDASSPGRQGQSAVWTDEVLAVWRGVVTTWDPVRLDWVGGQYPIGPQLYPGTTAVWTGSEIFFWGAGAGAGLVTGERGAALDLSTAEWRELAQSPLEPRSHPVVVWAAGGERGEYADAMYVWGGWVQSGDGGVVAASDGAAYDPETDTWRMLPPLPKEIALDRAIGGWVGDELIVVGVNDTPVDGAPAIGGAAYSPVTRTWRVIADGPRPTQPGEGLAGAMTAVVADDRLAVWLPASYFGDTAGFGFYDPAGDAWERVVDVPVDAYAPTLAWTGERVAALTEHGLLILTP